LFTTISLIYSSLYEITITSELIVPDKPYVADNVVELVKKGYRICILSYDIEGNRAIKGKSELLLQDSFEWDLVSYKLKKEFPRKTFGEVYLVHGKCNTMYASLMDEKNKLALEFQAAALDPSDVGDFTRVNHAGVRFDCHTAKQWIYGEPAEIIVNGPLTEEIMISLQTFRTAGLFNFWKQLHKLNFVERRILTIEGNNFPWKAQKYVDQGSQVISIMNLVPVFSVWMGFVGISAICFAVEMRGFVISGVCSIRRHIAASIAYIVNALKRLSILNCIKIMKENVLKHL